MSYVNCRASSQHLPVDLSVGDDRSVDLRLRANFRQVVAAARCGVAICRTRLQLDRPAASISAKVYPAAAAGRSFARHVFSSSDHRNSITAQFRPAALSGLYCTDRWVAKT